MPGLPATLTDAFLDEKRRRADATADAVVETIVRERGPDEAKRIFHMLIRQLEMPLDQLPPQVSAYAEETRALPEWQSSDDRMAAERVFVDHGPKLLVLLYYKSLPRIYTCAHAARVLTGTGRLAHDPKSLQTFSRRIAETGQFLVDVMAPGGMSPGGRGVLTTQKVRLVHAAIRRFTRDAGWDAEEAGEPVNQEDLAMTLTTFTVSLIDGLDQLGAPLSPGDAEGFLRHWNVAGHVLGIDADLLPATVEEGRALQRAVARRQARASDDGALLTKALIAFGEQVLPSGRLRNAPRTMIRYLGGEGTADMLRVPAARSWWSALVPLFVKRILGLVERLEEESEPVARVSDRLSRLAVRGMVEYFNHCKGQRFRIPDELMEAWEV